ncbi:RrF2 family transcriptional regulator [Pontiella agarivorans]|uniref:Rrf2 family transcriptional regulator n=1 Tax=Pontiella agarivorans TaxID=3038953 RepID=A0ABU5MVB7_9BACT|nr:Rrf2 family transcriptional regulator [Pontiella agarivorans]MDZ8118163.1 Rrf2 family transcriptional regulator [Pontiella agarivorans]
MTVSNRGLSAASIMLCIAENRHIYPLSKTFLAGRTGITVAYIGQLLMPLKNAGLVRSQRGMYGGYRLACRADDITLYDIIIAAEGTLDVVGQLERCSRCAQPCMNNLWCGASKTLRDYFRGITLKQLMEQQDEAEWVQPPLAV